MPRSCAAGHDGGMSNYRRIYVPGGTYFFTVNLLERRRTLLVDRIDLLRDAFRAVRKHLPFTLLASVVMRRQSTPKNTLTPAFS